MKCLGLKHTVDRLGKLIQKPVTRVTFSSKVYFPIKEVRMPHSKLQVRRLDYKLNKDVIKGALHNSVILSSTVGKHRLDHLAVYFYSIKSYKLLGHGF